MLKHNGKTYSQADLLRIGNNVASGWGATCHAFTFNKAAGTVNFECNECGEFFVTSIEFSDIGEYDY
jgi:hypothetical protein